MASPLLLFLGSWLGLWAETETVTVGLACKCELLEESPGGGLNWFAGPDVTLGMGLLPHSLLLFISLLGSSSEMAMASPICLDREFFQTLWI